MRDFKNIDRIFQENLKDYEVSPPNRSWNSIEKNLPQTKVKRRIPYWLKISSVAAILIFFFRVGTIYFIPSNNFAKNLFNKNKLNLGTEDVNNENDVPLKEAESSNATKVIPLSDRAEEVVINDHNEVADDGVNDLNESNETSINNSLSRFSLADAKNYP